jgi:hypothetical protein
VKVSVLDFGILILAVGDCHRAGRPFPALNRPGGTKIIVSPNHRAVETAGYCQIVPVGLGDGRGPAGASAQLTGQSLEQIKIATDAGDPAAQDALADC